MNSLTYFAQPRYWRADYGYRGDCEAKEPILVLRKDENQGLSADDVLRKVKQQRNVVIEIAAVLKAVKPIRPADRALQPTPRVKFQLV